MVSGSVRPRAGASPDLPTSDACTRARYVRHLSDRCIAAFLRPSRYVGPHEVAWAPLHCLRTNVRACTSICRSNPASYCPGHRRAQLTGCANFSASFSASGGGVKTPAHAAGCGGNSPSLLDQNSSDMRMVFTVNRCSSCVAVEYFEELVASEVSTRLTVSTLCNFQHT